MGRKPLPAVEKRVGFTFSLDPDVLALAKMIARMQDRRVSYLIDDAIRLYAKEFEKDPSKLKTPAGDDTEEPLP